MTGLSIGRYSPYNSFIHRLDPRNKIFLSLSLVVIVFFKFSIWSTSIIMSSLYLILFIFLMIISKVSFIDLFRSLKGMWFLVLFIFLVYVFIPNNTYTVPAFNIGQYIVYYDAFYQAGYIIIRLVLMLSIMMVLTSTTKPMELTSAIEWYMSPLKIIRFPAHEIAMTISIALRFIPTLLDETERIMKAQSSRGVDFNRGGLFKRFRAITSLIIPLFVSAIDRSEELANAMEVRGYNPKAKRTRFKKMTFSWRDLLSFCLTILFISGIIVLFIIDKRTSSGLNLIEILFHINPGF